MIKYYSNEIVFRGHPDKVCDQISDALLDAYLQEDGNSRCAIEVVGGKGVIMVTGEVTSKAKVNLKDVVKRVLTDVGYKTDYEIIDNIGVQSNEIALGTNKEVGGAGDNGMMFGYATNETEELLPEAAVILQSFAKKYDELRKKDSRFSSDGKAQITGVYDHDFKLQHIKTATICYQNTETDREATDQMLCDMFQSLTDKPIKEFFINPTGKFEIGGFEADTGLTGRKIVVDNYQSFANVGGGAFSGKDPSKVDRSGAYKAREIAIQILTDQNLKWVEVQLSYAIGKKRPLAIYVDSNIGNIEVSSDLYTECEPNKIIKDLKLKRPQYEKKARYGHFTKKGWF